jgi:hypothetical protein
MLIVVCMAAFRWLGAAAAPGNTTGYCLGAPSNCSAEWLVIRPADGGTLSIDTSCQTQCGDCQPVACSAICPAPSPLGDGGAQSTWDGTYYASATCGAGMACVSQTCCPARKLHRHVLRVRAGAGCIGFRMQRCLDAHVHRNALRVAADGWQFGSARSPWCIGGGCGLVLPNGLGPVDVHIRGRRHGTAMPQPCDGVRLVDDVRPGVRLHRHGTMRRRLSVGSERANRRADGRSTSETARPLSHRAEPALPGARGGAVNGGLHLFLATLTRVHQQFLAHPRHKRPEERPTRARLAPFGGGTRT